MKHFIFDFNTTNSLNTKECDYYKYTFRSYAWLKWHRITIVDAIIKKDHTIELTDKYESLLLRFFGLKYNDDDSIQFRVLSEKNSHNSLMILRKGKAKFIQISFLKDIQKYLHDKIPFHQNLMNIPNSILINMRINSLIGDNYNKLIEIENSNIDQKPLFLFSGFLYMISASILPFKAIENDNYFDNFFIERIHKIMYNNPHISIKEIAENLNIPYRSLNYKYKKLTGANLNDSLLKNRIETAKVILKSDYSIKQVAFACGYDDSQSFTRFFKKQTGLTPTQYKKGN